MKHHLRMALIALAFAPLVANAASRVSHILLRSEGQYGLIELKISSDLAKTRSAELAALLNRIDEIDPEGVRVLRDHGQPELTGSKNRVLILVDTRRYEDVYTHLLHYRLSGLNWDSVSRDSVTFSTMAIGTDFDLNAVIDVLNTPDLYLKDYAQALIQLSLVQRKGFLAQATEDQKERMATGILNVLGELEITHAKIRAYIDAENLIRRFAKTAIDDLLSPSDRHFLNNAWIQPLRRLGEMGFKLLDSADRLDWALETGGALSSAGVSIFATDPEQYTALWIGRWRAEAEAATDEALSPEFRSVSGPMRLMHLKVEATLPAAERIPLAKIHRNGERSRVLPFLVLGSNSQSTEPQRQIIDFVTSTKNKVSVGNHFSRLAPKSSFYLIGNGTLVRFFSIMTSVVPNTPHLPSDLASFNENQYALTVLGILDTLLVKRRTDLLKNGTYLIVLDAAIEMVDHVLKSEGAPSRYYAPARTAAQSLQSLINGEMIHALNLITTATGSVAEACERSLQP